MNEQRGMNIHRDNWGMAGAFTLVLIREADFAILCMILYCYTKQQNFRVYQWFTDEVIYSREDSNSRWRLAGRLRMPTKGLVPGSVATDWTWSRTLSCQTAPRRAQPGTMKLEISKSCTFKSEKNLSKNFLEYLDIKPITFSQILSPKLFNLGICVEDSYFNFCNFYTLYRCFYICSVV